MAPACDKSATVGVPDDGSWCVPLSSCLPTSLISDEPSSLGVKVWAYWVARERLGLWIRRTRRTAVVSGLGGTR
eukprot:280978-Amorphochlora_amoeboformis.AAC.1